MRASEQMKNSTHIDNNKIKIGYSFDFEARQLCSQATYVCDLLSRIKSSRLELKEPDLPDLDTWLFLYRNHGSFYDIHSKIYETNTFTREQFEKLLEQQEIDLNSGEPPVDLWDLEENQTIEEKMALVEEEFIEQHMQRDQDRIHENLKSPEAYFLIRAFIP